MYTLQFLNYGYVSDFLRDKTAYVCCDTDPYFSAGCDCQCVYLPSAGDKIPLPFIQIAIGAGLSLFGFDVAFEPHLFLFLFIPPLLFLDGWRIPKEALFSDIKPIFSLAIGLVFFTVVGMGLFIHWLIPAVSLAVAFALAAILSPTDPCLWRQ